MGTKDDAILHEAIRCGILDAERLAEIVTMTKKEKVKEVHSKQIRQRTDGRYETYVGKGKERKPVTAKTEEGLYNKLYDYYYWSEDSTIEQLYAVWKKERIALTELGRLDVKTVQRCEQYWQRYYKDHPIIHKPIKDVKLIELNTFFDAMIAEHDMTHHEFKNVKSVMNGIYNVAMKEEIIEVNIMHEVKVSMRFRAERKKPTYTKVYMSDDYKILCDALTKSDDILDKAILLQCQTGLRAGELVAIRWSDIDFRVGHMYIHASEKKKVRYDEESDSFVQEGRSVDGKVKSDSPDGYRDILLTDAALAILKSIPHQGDYVFMIDGKRITYDIYDDHLEKACKLAGVPFKPSHSLRRTYASRCADAGMPLETLRRQLGHTNIDTTKGYVYDMTPEREALKIMNKAL